MAEQRTKTTKQGTKRATGETVKPASVKKTATKAAKKAGPAPLPKAAAAKKTTRKAPAASKTANPGGSSPLSRRPRGPRPPSSEAPAEEARALALAAAEAGLDKKAVGIEILDVLGKVDYTDYLVLMTGRSDRHVDAIAQGILEALEKNKKKKALSIEGLQAAVWVLIDFGDIVVHVFQEEARETYDIAGLWLDAARLPVPEGAGEG